MNFNGRFVDAVLDKEIGDLGALIALELNDLTQLLIFDEGSIACEFLISTPGKP